MDRKDRDIEILSVKVHQQAVAATAKDNFINNMSQTTATLAGVKDGQSLFESYLVTSLKKQNRDLKQEVEQKSEQIDRLKREMKLTKGIEVDHEMQSYIEEC
jgi:hypothetical protein